MISRFEWGGRVGRNSPRAYGADDDDGSGEDGADMAGGVLVKRLSLVVFVGGFGGVGGGGGVRGRRGEGGSSVDNYGCIGLNRRD